MNKKLFLLELYRLTRNFFDDDEDWDTIDFTIRGRDEEMQIAGDRHITSGVVYNIPSNDPNVVGRFTEGKFTDNGEEL